MPASPPRLTLPESHRAWDELAARLPDLARDLRLRAAVDALPQLPADADALPDDALLRAASLLGIVAHAYYRIKAGEPAALPAALLHPWQTVSRRLGRPEPILAYIDLIVANWRLLDPDAPDLRRVENMALLIPTVDNREERIFYLTQVEILERCAPVVEAVVRAQEAVARDDPEALERELTLVATCLTSVAQESLAKIDPNPASSFYVDPLVWAKTVAPLAVPIFPGAQGPSGTTSPIFSLLDAFFGRSAYRSQLGQEMLHQRALYPPHWSALLAAVGQISVRAYVERRGRRALSGVFQPALDAYAGEYGFLGRHRLKVYGYLELAFKVGRSVTIGGFAGLFRERAWDRVDLALEDSRRERAPRAEVGWRRGAVRAVTPLGRGPSAHHLTLDVGGEGLRFRPGDRCSILPENPPALVARTLAALRATGDEPVGLNTFWRAPGEPVTLKVVAPPRFGLPDDPATPIVMIAGGSGIAPFRSFLQARAVQPGSGPTHLFFSTRTRDELYFAEELARHVVQGQLRLQIALTRDDSADPRRIDDLLLADEHAALLRQLLRPDDERGAVCYVCGRAGFAATVQGALRAILDGRAPGATALERLAAQGRYREEIYSTYVGALPDEVRQIDASELVLQGHPDDEPWMAISGRVYDLGTFLRLHPGGAKILRAYLGMDATRAYRQVQHHLRPEVDAQLAMYLIGSLRRIDFGSAWAITVGDEGLCYTPLAEAYKTWARTLYLVVEMENALALDSAIHHGATTGADPAGAVTPLKAQLLAEVHQRFIANCLRGLVAPVSTLWGLVCGLGGRGEDIRWLRRALEELLGDEGAAPVETAGAEPMVDVVRLETFVALDRALLRALKAVLRDGLRIFEAHGPATAEGGGADLLAIARRVPGCYAGYLDDARTLLRP